MTLYCFRVLACFNTDCFAFPISRASGWNTQCSPSHARARYTMPSPIIYSLKSKLMFVSCMSLDTQPNGKINTNVMQSAVAIVATNGPTQESAEESD